MNNSSYSITAVGTFHTQITFYIIVSVIGSVGNSVTAIVLLQPNNRLKTGTILLLNLTICDFIVSSISVPLNVTEMLMGYFPFGNALCKIIYPFQTSLTIVSSWTLMFMMIERHCVLQSNIPRRRSLKRMCTMAMLAWVLSIFLVVPYGLHLTYTFNTNHPSCSERWPDIYVSKIYTLILFVFDYVIPMTTIIVLVIKIGLYLKSEHLLVRKGTLGLNKKSIKQRKARCAKLAIVFIVMALIYGIMKLPNNVYWIYLDHQDNYFGDKNPDIPIMVALISHATSIVNPFILYFMSNSIRREFTVFFTCKKGKCQAVRNHTSRML